MVCLCSSEMLVVLESKELLEDSENLSVVAVAVRTVEVLVMGEMLGSGLVSVLVLALVSAFVQVL